MARKSRKQNRNSRTTASERTPDSVVESPSPVTSDSSSGEIAPRPSAITGTVADSDAIEPVGDRHALDDRHAVDDSAQLLTHVSSQIDQLHQMFAELSHRVVAGPIVNTIASNDEVDQIRFEVEELASRLRLMEDENDELRQQNDDLATQLANSNIRKTVSNAQSSTSDALTWDERKALIMQQMESETFDADVFVDELQSELSEAAESISETETPTEFVSKLIDLLNKREEDLANRNAEIGELRLLLEQPCEVRDASVVVGAAAIAQLVDADELVLQERNRLQLLQAEWEEKFRRSEIEASLERAKLSRERQELSNKTAQLEEQIEHLRRETRQTEETGSGNSRRWLVKLGLSDDES
ncbi:hypothetical protein Poly51_54210 [Rubripirellula tenax]|uniref:Uncharacterized protein n=1 Tax=Rubripirellula tenax TaxID=2528015 RepID=A0A5C6EGB6_9BACT|nr:hypothetical protein [Rubripirellula tenax]TWU47620.1 hypothetical protein Poly51_54210 [Rubripirellula tenax]